ncbi:MAG TPA: hypothetical protein VIN59_01285 [Alphaproteobacteria bacterium]
MKPDFRIAFKQNRRYSRPDLSTLLDQVAKLEYFDREVEYSRSFMVAGPYQDLTSQNRKGRTAMFARVDRLTGILNLEIRNWVPPLRSSGSTGYGLLDIWGQAQGNKINMGHVTTLAEAKEKLTAFANDCQTQGLSEIRTFSWIDGGYYSAVELYDASAQREANKKQPQKSLVSVGAP